MHPEADQYVIDSLESGMNLKEIRQSLHAEGWSAEQVNNLIKKALRSYAPRRSTSFSPFFPSGGLQIYASIFGLFSRFAWIRFHALEALVYWVFWIALVWPLATFYAKFNLSSSIFIALLVFYSLGLGIILPAYLSWRYGQRKAILFPLLWYPIAFLTGYRPAK